MTDIDKLVERLLTFNGLPEWKGKEWSDIIDLSQEAAAALMEQQWDWSIRDREAQATIRRLEGEIVTLKRIAEMNEDEIDVLREQLHQEIELHDKPEIELRATIAALTGKDR